jgi:hypothetical protein
VDAVQPGQIWTTTINNPSLFADVAEAVMGLQLQPDRVWVAWSYNNSLALLQQQQPQQQQHQHQHQEQTLLHEQKQRSDRKQPRGWLLVITLQLAAYLAKQQQQQQQQKQNSSTAPAASPSAGPSPEWLSAWVAAAVQLPQPFNKSQLLKVTQALCDLQLQQQMPGSFWAKHLTPADVQSLKRRDLLQLLQHLPAQQQQQQQQQQLVPAEWLQVAAEALPEALAAAGRSSDSAAAAAAAVPNRWLLQHGTGAAAAAVQGLVSAGWQGADLTWCQRMWASVLGLPQGTPAAAVPQQAAAAAVSHQAAVSLQQDSLGRNQRSPTQDAGTLPAGAAAAAGAAADGGSGASDTGGVRRARHKQDRLASSQTWMQFCTSLHAALAAAGPATSTELQPAAAAAMGWAAALQDMLLAQQQQQQQHGVLPAGTAASLLVCLVQQGSSSSGGGSRNASVAGFEPLLSLLLDGLRGQLHHLRLMSHLLPLARALLAPVTDAQGLSPGLSGAVLGAADQQQPGQQEQQQLEIQAQQDIEVMQEEQQQDKQQQQKQQQRVNRLVLYAPELAVEYVQQVSCI